MFFFQFLHILPGLFVSVHNHSPWGDTPSGMDTFYKPNCTCTTTHTQTHTDTQTFIAASPTSLFIFSLFIFSISSIVHTSHPSSSPLPPSQARGAGLCSHWPVPSIIPRRECIKDSSVWLYLKGKTRTPSRAAELWRRPIKLFAFDLILSLLPPR